MSTSIAIVNGFLEGEGNFGVVWKAKAEGIVENAPHLNIVAVKTIKGTYICHFQIHSMPELCTCITLDALNVQAIDDFFLELIILLKIMPHLNICNLLGFCNSKS